MSTKKESPAWISSLWHRAEPWILFLSILLLPFLREGRGICWSAIFGILLIRSVLRWREAWKYFSLDTIGNFVRSLLVLCSFVLLLFFLHGIAPDWTG